MKHYIKVLLSVIVTVWISYWVIYAWSWLTASDGDTLTHTKWNELYGIVSSNSGKLDWVSNTNGNIILDNETNANKAKIVVDNIDQKLVLGSYYEAWVKQYWSIQSTNDAESAVIDLVLNEDGGNVGIGTITPAQTLTVSGSLNVTGAATFDTNPLSCTTRTNSVNVTSYISVIVNCNAGEVLTGWGCYANLSNGAQWVNNRPVGNGWDCRMGSTYTANPVIAHAICCKMN
jgi:hypothetical protein